MYVARDPEPDKYQRDSKKDRRHEETKISCIYSVFVFYLVSVMRKINGMWIVKKKKVDFPPKLK